MHKTMNQINYGKLVDEAMHHIVYKVLKNIEKDGLPHDHHFFISFITKHPEVKISEALRNKYPHEMTVVLQYQFHNLKVDEKGFSVTLSFTGNQESVYVPLSAITTFADPSVQFGLQFREAESFDESDIDDEDLDMITEEIKRQLEEDMEHEDGARGGASTKSDDDNVISLEDFKRKKEKNGTHNPK